MASLAWNNLSAPLGSLEGELEAYTRLCMRFARAPYEHEKSLAHDTVVLLRKIRRRTGQRAWDTLIKQWENTEASYG